MAPAPDIEALFFVAVLLVCRLASRRNLPAYGLLFLVLVAIVSWGRLAAEPWCKAAPAATLIVAALVAGGTCVAIVKEGLLAAAVYSTVAIALDKTPLTYDLTRWYAWRTGVVVVLISALLYWGFRNVLGRQPAFPAPSLDD